MDANFYGQHTHSQNSQITMICNDKKIFIHLKSFDEYVFIDQFTSLYPMVVKSANK